MKTAILVDGGFYRRCVPSVFGELSAEDRVEELYDYCLRHLSSHGQQSELYRIFYYDCLPSSKIIYHPLLKKQIDMSKTDLYTWMNIFIDKLKTKRKVAIRLGKISDENAEYSINAKASRKLCAGNLSIDALKESDFTLSMEQKGVDMKIGLDIASLAYKRQVDQIVLISGDSDFVPASKLARREGIDFILDPLGRHIKDDLLEHIDGLRSCDKKLLMKNDNTQGHA